MQWCLVVSDFLWPHWLYPARLFCPWNFPGKNTGVGCHFLIQGNFCNPGIKPASSAPPTLASRFFTTSATWEDPSYMLKMEVKSENHSVVSDSLWPYGLYSPWNSLGQNPGVGSFSLLQEIFPTQGSNPGLLHCRWVLYQLSHKGSPRNWSGKPIPFPTDLADPGKHEFNKTLYSKGLCCWIRQ